MVLLWMLLSAVVSMACDQGKRSESVVGAFFWVVGGLMHPSTVFILLLIVGVGRFPTTSHCLSASGAIATVLIKLSTLLKG